MKQAKEAFHKSEETARALLNASTESALLIDLAEKKLQEAIAQIKTLSGMLPICSSCKKIRDDKGYWNQIESYIQDHSDVGFSHSICPDCAKKLYADLDIYHD
ncbi:MAG: hypothetical protein GY705_02410 [Bacteroidetes bacterium]|nr:hypothetical protein [Bacteroidota bacterium]